MADSRQQMHQCARGLVEKTAELTEKGQEEPATHLVDQNGEMGHKVHRWSGDAYEATVDNLKEGVNGSTDLIRKCPIPALLVGFGMGLVIGRVLCG